jgi:hypothetical protein
MKLMISVPRISKWISIFYAPNEISVCPIPLPTCVFIHLNVILPIASLHPNWPVCRLSRDVAHQQPFVSQYLGTYIEVAFITAACLSRPWGLKPSGSGTSPVQQVAGPFFSFCIVFMFPLSSLCFVRSLLITTWHHEPCGTTAPAWCSLALAEACYPSDDLSVPAYCIMVSSEMGTISKHKNSCLM